MSRQRDVTKTTSGAAAGLAAGQTFTVLATWTDAQGVERSDGLTLVAGGRGDSINGIPMGTVVTLTELDSAIPGIDSSVPTFISTSPGVVIAPGGSSALVTIGDRTISTMRVDNGVSPEVPAIEIVKGDAAGNAADDAASSVDLTATGGTTDLVFTITNTGTEPLDNLVVRDVVASGGTVSDLACVFPGSTTAVAAGASNVVTAPVTAVPCRRRRPVSRARRPVGVGGRLRAAGREPGRCAG